MPEKTMRRARLLAFYLPQFHPIPENDLWWGKGFTEWTNVVRARPLFPGHYQPRLPGELGFYDLRLPEVRAAQAALAREHGIEGFCYWHYWSLGKRLLERPFEEVLKSGEPDFPFCLAWANGNWTKEWRGDYQTVHVEQKYSAEDCEKHFYYLLGAFADSRYITVDGKPFFYIMNPLMIPNVEKFFESWRRLAAKEGLKGLHLVGGVTGDTAEKIGLDAYSSQYPYWCHMVHYFSLPRYRRVLLRNFRKILKWPAIYDYRKQILEDFKDNYTSEERYYPLIVPNWDNTSRFGWRGMVLHNESPELFRIHVRRVLQQVLGKPFEKRIIFVRSWNEWAEGNHLEPDQKFGRGYLEVLKEEVCDKIETRNAPLESFLPV